jgi:putative ABC transport system permease protein
MKGPGVLSRWLLMGEWRAHLVRALMAVLAIAVGVSLGFAIHLINASAFNEFSAAVRSLSGQADLQLTGSESYFDERIFTELAQRRGIEVASPVLIVHPDLSGKPEALKVIALDAFRASAVTPDLMGVGSALHDAIADDAIFLSPAAQAWLKPGPTLSLQSGADVVRLRVAGSILGARSGQRFAVMDIAAAQWRFGLSGKLSRIDIKLAEGTDRTRFQQALVADLNQRYPGRFVIGHPDDGNEESRNNSMSRAYRVNLTVLALVALFTGAFLVFSTQALSVIRRRSQFALLRTLGWERGQLMRQILLEGASLGVIGAGLGIALGYGMAATAISVLGGDLGAGYFSGVQPALDLAPMAALVFFTLGCGTAILGVLAPAFDAARAAPAVALKSGSADAALQKLSVAWPSVLAIVLAGAMAFAPPVYGLPLFGYAAIALLLVGGIGLMPRFASRLFGAVDRLSTRMAHARTVPTLAAARLANASGQAAIALGGVLCSFSLMVAMAIMVSSFRHSVDQWIGQLLQADLYVSVASAGNTATLGPKEQALLTALPGAERIDFLRMQGVVMDPAQPKVAVMARHIDTRDPSRTLTIEGPSLPVPAGARAAWVSESMVDLYGIKPGQTMQLPLGGKAQPFFVAGVWRDYARQTGTVAIQLDDYRAVTGDQQVSALAVWFKDGVGAAQVRDQIKALPIGRKFEFSEPDEIRALSLEIFDRSFAVTYLLELIAIAIGMSGVAATFSAQTLARSREFGMLRHVGVTRGQILGILALEGGALTGLGVLCGFILGFIISLILVHVVNPQSFHLTMELHMPWTLLGAVAAVLLFASTLTALASGRHALSTGPLRAVREDW